MSNPLTIDQYLSHLQHGPLTGIVVACMGSQICGSWTSEQLARKGAAVIKIEKPDSKGDPKRRNSPPTAFNQFNVGKIGVQFENSARGEAHRAEILRAAHVIVDNRSNGAKERDRVLSAVMTENRATRPLIYCGMSGYGSTDARKAYDRSLQAAVGMADLNGDLVPFPLIDMCAGTEAAKLILEQLLYVERMPAEERHKMDTMRIDLAMANVAMSLMSNMAALHHDTGSTESSIVPFGLFDTKTRKLGLALARDHQFAALCEALELEDMAVSYSTNQLRLENRREVEDRIQGALWAKSAEEWAQIFIERDIPAEPVQTFAEAMDVYGPRMMVADSDGGQYMRSPGILQENAMSPPRTPMLRAPKLGEHNELALEFAQRVRQAQEDPVRVRQMIIDAAASVGMG